jgi:hypothetical protein
MDFEANTPERSVFIRYGVLIRFAYLEKQFTIMRFSYFFSCLMLQLGRTNVARPTSTLKFGQEADIRIHYLVTILKRL